MTGGLLTVTRLDCDPRPGPGQGLHQRDGTGKAVRNRWSRRLNKASGHVRTEISRRMHIRKAPRFVFVADEGAAYAAHINKLLGELAAKAEPAAEGRCGQRRRIIDAGGPCPPSPEKRNCMTQSVDHETVVSRLLSADEILILCHKNPDGDTIGSGTALCLALQKAGQDRLRFCAAIPFRPCMRSCPSRCLTAASRPVFVVAVGRGRHPAVRRPQQYAPVRRTCRPVHRPSRLQQRLCLRVHGGRQRRRHGGAADGTDPRDGRGDHARYRGCLYTGIATDPPAASGSPTPRRPPTARRQP